MSENTPDPNRKRSGVSGFDLWLPIGVAIGIALGVAMDNYLSGLAIGLSIGVVLGTATKRGR